MDLDSTVSEGAIVKRFSGTFEIEIEGMDDGEYILKASHIGFEDRYHVLTIENGIAPFLEITLGNIYHSSELPFHEVQAEHDLKRGVVQFKLWGMIVGGPDPLEDQELQEKYGFNVVHLYEKYPDASLQQGEKLRQDAIRYNIVVDSYLLEEYPGEWTSVHGIW